MKKINNFIILLMLFVTFASCNSNETTSSALAIGNESGDVWDTMSMTTAYPVSLVTNMELEIGANHDTIVLHSEKLLKVKVNGGYSQYCAYTESVLFKSLLSEKVPQGYCLDLTVLASKRGFSNRDVVVVSYAIKKIVNQMGG